MDLRSRISDLIKKSSLSIRQLALKSGVRRQSISHFLAGGNIHIKNLQKLLAALGYQFMITEIGEEVKGPLINILLKRIAATPKQLETFCEKHNITYMAFFGSILREDFAEDSDIDVLIRLGEKISLFDLVGIEQELKELLGTDHEVHVLTEKSVSPLIRDEIYKNLEVIYEAA